LPNEDIVGQYWSIDIPGLVERQASALLSRLGEIDPSLRGSILNPADFMTIHVDRPGVEVILSGLRKMPQTDIGDGLIEIVNDWIAQARQ
jgi:hypothetical protein